MRALCISGGGEKASYSVGVLKHLLGNLNINYDILTGSSSGAINCAYLGQFKKGQELEAIVGLEKLWLNLKKENIYKEWLLGRISGFWNSSFLNSKPLCNTIEKNISIKKIRASGKKIGVGAVSIETGKHHIFYQDDPNFIKATIGSSSFPGAFKPINFLGLNWIDAGLKSVSPISTAISMGADEVDVIITSPELRVRRFKENPTAIEILYRSLDLTTDKILTTDLHLTEMHNKLAAAGLDNKKEIKIRVLRPDYNLTDKILEFDPGDIRSMIDIGYAEAQRKYIL